jgi:hypothetical protein
VATRLVVGQLPVLCSSRFTVTRSPGSIALLAGGQLSVTRVAGPAAIVVAAGVSWFTVTVKLQLGPAVVMQVTVVVPAGKNEPEAGEQVTVPQLPVVLGAG